jgi:hypothetical protein
MIERATERDGAGKAVDILYEILKIIMTFVVLGIVLVGVPTLFIVVFKVATDMDDRLTH